MDLIGAQNPVEGSQSRGKCHSQVVTSRRRDAFEKLGAWLQILEPNNSSSGCVFGVPRGEFRRYIRTNEGRFLGDFVRINVSSQDR